MNTKKKNSGKYEELSALVLDGIEKKDILAIESEIKGFQADSFEARASAILLLQYLKNSGRFRENPYYKNSTFEVYLDSVYGITYKSFHDMGTAIIYYPEAEKYGAGTIAKIRNLCGVAKVKKVLSEIKAEETKRAKPITRMMIKDIIDRNKSPQEPSTPKPPEHDFRADNEKLRATIAEQKEELTILRDQVSRQIETIVRLRAKNAELLAENVKLREQIPPTHEAENGTKPTPEMRASA
jgi:hypothetical protein